MLIINKSRKLPFALMTAAALGGFALLIWLSSGGSLGDREAVVPVQAPTAPAHVERVAATPHPLGLPGSAEDLPPAPPEDPARVFDLGYAGGLVIDPSTVTALDRLHTLLGEDPTPEEIAALENKLRTGLPREEAEKAINLFRGYRTYNAGMRNEVMQMGIPATRAEADALLARMTSLQTRSFEPQAVEAMFGEQNKLSRAVLDAALIQMDPNLSNAQKKEQLDSLRASVPEAQRNSIPEMPAEPASAPTQ